MEDQASDRAHRIGQQSPVTIYRMVLAGTIEEKILELHATKHDLAESLLEGTDSIGKLTTGRTVAIDQDLSVLAICIASRRNR